jgi:hypothetical protein
MYFVCFCFAAPFNNPEIRGGTTAQINEIGIFGRNGRWMGVWLRNGRWTAGWAQLSLCAAQRRTRRAAAEGGV